MPVRQRNGAGPAAIRSRGARQLFIGRAIRPGGAARGAQLSVIAI